MSLVDEEKGKWFRQRILPLEPWLLVRARRMGGNIWLAPEDIVQETFVCVMKYDAWRDIREPAAFAHRILRNIVLRETGRAKIVSIQAAEAVQWEDVADDAPGLDRELEGRQQLQRLVEAVANLPPQCRKVFTMRKFHGMAPRDIAGRLGLSLSTVEKHLVKGLQRCARRLREPEDDLAPAGPGGRAPHPDGDDGERAGSDRSEGRALGDTPCAHGASR